MAGLGRVGRYHTQWSPPCHSHKVHPWVEEVNGSPASLSPTSRGLARCPRLDAPAVLVLSQQQVHNPTTADMLGRLAAVSQQIGIRAARIFEGVGKHRQAPEGAFVVDALGQLVNGAVLPRGIHRLAAWRLTKDIQQQLPLGGAFSTPRQQVRVV